MTESKSLRLSEINPYEKSRKFRIGPTKKIWRNLDAEEKLAYLHGAIITSPEYVPVQISIRFSPKTEPKARANPDYVRDEIRRVFKSVLGTDSFVFYLIVGENDPKKDRYSRISTPTHVHCCLGIINELYSVELIESLVKALKNSPLSAKYEEIGKNKTVVVSPTFSGRFKGELRPINFGWVSYLAQHKRFDLRKCQKVTALARALHLKCREKTIDIEVPISSKIEGLDWIVPG
ncbi:MAG: hypothetical protein JJ957_02090 [Pseudomonadales bacterium]|nr:hypothetical protein [Pseudomonadales bacterium]MBO6594602.1 hypothetical protein [Pseudomonadales bacterium]MBO6821837.1 hypothetical protein [Pseudomonadales bacterium]